MQLYRPCIMVDSVALRDAIADEGFKAKTFARLCGLKEKLMRKLLLGDRTISRRTADALTAAIGPSVVYDAFKRRKI